MVLVTRILSIKKPWQSKFDSIIFKAKKENQRKFKANRWLLERLWLAKSVTLSIRVTCWGVILKISLSILKIDGEWIGRYFICLSRQNHNLKVIDLLKTDILISELQVWKFHVSKWLSMIFDAPLPLKLGVSNLQFAPTFRYYKFLGGLCRIIESDFLIAKDHWFD